jgi:hypothetical protein
MSQAHYAPLCASGSSDARRKFRSHQTVVGGFKSEAVLGRICDDARQPTSGLHTEQISETLADQVAQDGAVRARQESIIGKAGEKVN